MIYFYIDDILVLLKSADVVNGFKPDFISIYPALLPYID